MPAEAMPAATRFVLRWAWRLRWALVGLCVLHYFSGYTGRWVFVSDSGKYLVVARNLVEGHGYWHPLGFHQRASPGLPWLEAASMRLFAGEVWPVVLLMVLLGLLGLWLAYQLFRTRMPREEALLAWVMLAVSQVWVMNSHRLFADMPFAVGVMVFLLGWERVRLARSAAEGGTPHPPPRSGLNGVALLAGGAIVMALFRSVALVVFAAAAAALLWHAARTGAWRVAAGGALGIAALLAVVQLLDPRVSVGGDEASVIAMLATDPGALLRVALADHLPRFFTETAAEALIGVDMSEWVSAIVGVVCVLLGLHLFRERPLWGCLFLAFFLQWLLFGMTERYFLPLLPLLALAWWRMSVWLGSVTPRPIGNVVWAALVIVWLVPNAIAGGAVARDAWWWGGERAPHERGLLALAQWIEPRLPADALVLSFDGDISDPLAFLSGRDGEVPVQSRMAVYRAKLEAGRLYVLRPTAENVEFILRRIGGRPSGPLATVPRGDGTSWTLHRVLPRATRDAGSPRSDP